LLVAVSVSLTADRSEPQVETATVFVTVLDGDNAPVTGLAASEFVITEDGTARTVTEARPAAEPMAVGVIVDTAQPPQGMVAPIRDLRAGLGTFVKTILGANSESRVALMEAGGAAVTTVDFTNQLEALTRGINRLNQSQRAASVILEGIVDLSRSIASQPAARRAIVTVDFNSNETSRIVERDFSPPLQRSGASVWTVSIRGSGAPPPNREAVLDWSVQVTGGLRLTAVAASALEANLRTVALALSSQYAVTYQRPAGTRAKDVRAAAARGAKFLTARPAGR
jgi:hypothetical protein